MLGRGCPLDEPPVKILGTKSLMDVPGGQHFTRTVTAHCWGSQRVPIGPPERALEAGAWSPHIAMCTFSLG